MTFRCRNFLTGAVLCLLLFAQGAIAARQPETTAFVDGKIKDPSRNNRVIDYRLSFPLNFTGSCPIIIISHGGEGAPNGYKRMEYLRLEYAKNGYIAININHLASKRGRTQELDRPADVDYLLDQLLAGKIKASTKFRGTFDLSHIGLAGHSWGAYTAQALAGGRYTHGSSFRDARISAFCPISPQGRDKFGSFDKGPGDNTWMNIVPPMLNFVGSKEVDGDTKFIETGWRFRSYERYPSTEAKYQALVPGADHLALSGGGTAAQLAYVAQNSRVFFDVYLRGQVEKKAQIGTLAWIKGAVVSSKSGDE